MSRRIALAITLSLSACSSRIASTGGSEVSTDSMAPAPSDQNNINRQSLTEAHRDDLRNELYTALLDRLRFLRTLGQGVDEARLPRLPAPLNILIFQSHAWEDSNGNRTFEADSDTILLGDPPEGAWGRRTGLRYRDHNLNGVFDQEELVLGVDDDRFFLRKLLMQINGLSKQWRISFQPVAFDKTYRQRPPADQTQRCLG